MYLFSHLIHINMYVAIHQLFIYFSLTVISIKIVESGKV